MSTAFLPKARSGTSTRLTNGAWSPAKLALRIIPELDSNAELKLGHDSSTKALIRRYCKLKAN